MIIFQPPDILESPLEIQLVSLENAEGIVCTGPFNPKADPETMRPQLLYAKKRGLKFLCVNPDIVVDRGHFREWCAGSLASIYSDIGGESLYFGKPHVPIYNLALSQLEILSENTGKNKILAIGDGIQTDIKGAINYGIDSLFITGGLASLQTQTNDQPNKKALQAFFNAENQFPTLSIGFLR